MKRKKQKHTHKMERTNGIPTSLFYSIEGLRHLIENCNDAHTLEQLYRENRKRVDTDIPTMQAIENKRVLLLLA